MSEVNMSNEERVQQIKQGKDEKNNMERLFIDNRRFVVMIIKRTLKNNYIPEDIMEDFIQGSYFALVKSVKAYDPLTTECKFLAYYKNHIIKQLLTCDLPQSNLYDFVIDKKGGYRIYIESLDKPLPGGDEEGRALDYLEDKKAVEAFERVEDEDSYSSIMEMVRAALSEQRLYEVIKHKMSGKTNEEVSQEMGTCVKTIVSDLRKAKKKLKNKPIFWNYYNDVYLVNAYRRIGVNQFNTTFTSSVEEAAIRNERTIFRNSTKEC